MVFLTLSVFLMFKSLVFLLLRSPSFLNSFSHSLLPPKPVLTPPPSPLHSFLLSIYATCTTEFTECEDKISKRAKTRTDDRRVRALLQPSLTREDADIFDDSEEENRISGRWTRLNRDKAAQTNSSSSSFCCGVIVGVFVVVSLFSSCLVFFSVNGKQSLAK